MPDMDKEIIKLNKETCEYLKHRQKTITIQNCVTTICFTALAIIFKSWWLVLVAGLFLSNPTVNVGIKQDEEEQWYERNIRTNSSGISWSGKPK